MAFTGTIVTKQISDSLVRITGANLANAANGTIGFADKTAPAGLSLPEGFIVEPTSRNGVVIGLQDQIEVVVNLISAVATPTPLSIVKTGTTPADFAITITNLTATQTANLEIYIRAH